VVRLSRSISPVRQKIPPHRATEPQPESERAVA
jgi:hypothetical protein